MLHDVNDLHAGGFILVTHITPLGIEKSQTYPTAVLNNQLQSKAKLPLLIGADFERGSAMRLDEGTSFPDADGHCGGRRSPRRVHHGKDHRARSAPGRACTGFMHRSRT